MLGYGGQRLIVVPELDQPLAHRKPHDWAPAHVNLLRVPPGREAFILHCHSVQEEWSFIIEGEGTAHIGEEKIKVATGDFIAFPANGKAHTIVNTGTRDLVYLTSGEDSPHEIGHFPSINKIIVFSSAGVDLIDTTAKKSYSIQDFMQAGLITGDVDTQGAHALRAARRLDRVLEPKSGARAAGVETRRA